MDKIVKNNVTYITSNSTKFQTNLISLRWCIPIDKKIVADLLVLSELMVLSTMNYDSSKKLSNKLANLYDTKLRSNISQNGKQLIVEIDMDFVDSSNLPRNIDGEVIELFSEVINNINIYNDNYINSIKTKCYQDIDSIYDDKMKYSFIKMQEVIDFDENIILNTNSNKESIEMVNTDSLLQAYNYVIKNAKTYILVEGKSAVKITEELSKIFDDKFSSNEYEYFNLMESFDQKIVTEKQQLNQTKFVIGSCLSINAEDFMSMQMFNAIYGGFAFSRLFTNIREKQSLAYTVASGFNSGLNLMYVYGGIANKDVEQDFDVMKDVYSALNFELESIKNGNISDLEINQARSMLQNNLRSAMDKQTSVLDLYFRYELLGKEFNYELYIDKLNSIGAKEIQKMANLISFDAIFLLRGVN